jgi:NADH-quinone oxidoreductase E subunit
VSLQRIFSESEIADMERITQQYEDLPSALMPLLHYVQKVRGYLDEDELVFVADLLQIPHVRAYEVATYFTMYTTNPRGKHLIQVCRNLSCNLAGCETIIGAIKSELGVEPGETTPDKFFTLVEVECIGACDMAPAVMVDEDLHPQVTAESLRAILDEYRSR